MAPGPRRCRSVPAVADHARSTRRRWWGWGLGLAGLCVALAAVDLLVGPGGIQWGDAPRLLALDPDSRFGQIVLQLRLPRVAAAVVAGSALALAGLVLQNNLGNPLASPYTLGISQAAAFGAAFAIIGLGVYQPRAELLLPPGQILAVSAFVAASLAMGAIAALLMLARLGPHAVVLAGVGLGSLFQSATMLLQYFGTDVDVAATLFWTFGDLAKAGWPEVATMALPTAVALGYFLARRWDYNALTWGDEVAASLGTRVTRLRVLTLALASLISAVVTAFLGIIGFVGLIAPHLARLVVGDDYRALVALSALTGAALLLAADLVARTALAPVTLPVGIVTAFLGVPLFLFLLVRSARP